jgi:hypothetical protein
MFAALGRGAVMDNYFLGGSAGARQPAQGVPSAAAPSPRLPNQPGQAIPAGQSPFPSSGQKPGNREGNQRIPYARFQFTWQEDSAKPREMRAGDVVFVHKMSQAMGHGHGRNIKVTGLPQLNRMLDDAGALDFDDATVVARVKQVRVARFEALRKASEQEEDDTRAAEYKKERDAAEAATPTAADFDKTVDWAALKMLTEWTLDGVLINVDDEVDVDDTDSPRFARDDGVLLNVCVQGPTPMRNTAWEVENFREGHEYEVQHVDNNVPVLDNVFVGLFAQRIVEGKTQTNQFKFQYRLFSGRQIYSMHLKRLPGKTPFEQQVPAPFSRGPTEADFTQIAGAWRVGTVMDNRLSGDAERLMQVNVCAEWWGLGKLRNVYDEDEDPIASRVGSEPA